MMLDLHYTKTIVLKVENRKSHRKKKTNKKKPRAQPHRRTRRFSRGFSSRGLGFPLHNVECPRGRQALVFLMPLSLWGVPLWPPTPHLHQMLLRCHDEAYPSPPPPNPSSCRQLLIFWNILPKSQLGGGRWNQPAGEQSHIHILIFFFLFYLFFLPLRQLLGAHPLFVLFFPVLGGGGEICAWIFVCRQDWGRQCPVLSEDSRGHYRKKPKGSGLCQGLHEAWGFIPDIPSLVCVCVGVCVRVCVCMFVSGDWWSAGRLGLEARSCGWWQHQAW